MWPGREDIDLVRIDEMPRQFNAAVLGGRRSGSERLINGYGRGPHIAADLGNQTKLPLKPLKLPYPQTQQQPKQRNKEKRETE